MATDEQGARVTESISFGHRRVRRLHAIGEWTVVTAGPRDARDGPVGLAHHWMREPKGP